MTNGNGTGVDLTGPLAGMWRDVYRKAGEVADARAREQLKYHVYTYPHGAGGGGGEAGPYVDEVGDTMTGTLRFAGSTVPLEGAVIISGTGVVATGARLLGPDSPPFTPTYHSHGLYDQEFGIKFSVTVNEYLGELRFYRYSTTQLTPLLIRLWDTTNTSNPIWSTSSLVDDGAVGWQATPIPEPSRPALTAGTIYILSVPYRAGDVWAYQNPFTPVPQTPIIWRGGCQNGSPYQGYPWYEVPNLFPGLDIALGGGPVTLEPAHTGAIRLPAGARVCWRAPDNLRDYCLGFDAAGNLLAAGEPVTSNLTTSTTAPTGRLNTMWFNPSESA